MRNKSLFIILLLWPAVSKAESLNIPSDSSRVYDLDEVVVVSQPKDT